MTREGYATDFFINGVDDEVIMPGRDPEDREYPGITSPQVTGDALTIGYDLAVPRPQVSRRVDRDRNAP